MRLPDGENFTYYMSEKKLTHLMSRKKDLIHPYLYTDIQGICKKKNWRQKKQNKKLTRPKFPAPPPPPEV